MTGWLTGLVRSAINPVFGWLSRSLLATPRLDHSGRVRSLWSGSVWIADTCFVLLVAIGGLTVMANPTLQTSYTVKDVAPRLVVGAVLANVSLPLIGRAIEVANALSAALLGPGVNPHQAAQRLMTVLTHAIDPGAVGGFVVFIALATVVLGVILLLVYIVRLMITIVLIVAAPLALACHAVPQLEGIAKFWWRAMAAILSIQVLQALVFATAMRLFWSTNSTTPLRIYSPGADIDLLITLCLLYILVRIPWWVSRPVFAAFGPSPIRRLGRYAVGALVLSRASRALAGGRAGPRDVPGKQTRTTRRTWTDSKGQTHVRTQTAASEAYRFKQRGVAHAYTTTKRSTTRRTYPPMGEGGVPRPPGPARTTASETTTHTATSRRKPYRNPPPNPRGGGARGQ